MKRMTMTALSLVFAAVFAAAASGQAATATKIVVVDSAAFGEKDGITRYINAVDALEKEFTAQTAELRKEQTRYQTLEKELRDLQEQIQKGTVPINENSARAKSDEFANLQVKLKRMQEDLEKALQRREPVVIGPVTADIMKAMQEFSTKNGYDYIFDAQRLPAGMLLAFNAKNNVTKEFIAFYNARPATTAAATTPATRP
jgi:Skp family chaperone for outer membrane proteins